MANWMEVLLLAATVGLVAAAPSPSPPPATPVVYYPPAAPVTYVAMSPDTNTCGDNIALTSAAECQAAAAQLSLPWAGQGVFPTQPKGCFLLIGPEECLPTTRRFLLSVEQFL